MLGKEGCGSVASCLSGTLLSSITLGMGGRQREGTFPSGLVANFSGTQLLVSFINLLFVSKKYF